MTTAVARVSVDISGSVIGSASIAPAAQSFTDALGELEYLDLASGNNTITLPTSPEQATAVLIVPPDDNTDALVLKGVNGDTGVGISPDTPTWLPFGDTPPTNFVLNAAGAVPGVLFVWV